MSLYESLMESSNIKRLKLEYEMLEKTSSQVNNLLTVSTAQSQTMSSEDMQALIMGLVEVNKHQNEIIKTLNSQMRILSERYYLI